MDTFFFFVRSEGNWDLLTFRAASSGFCECVHNIETRPVDNGASLIQRYVPLFRYRRQYYCTPLYSEDVTDGCRGLNLDDV